MPHTDVREACFGMWDSFADVGARAGLYYPQAGWRGSTALSGAGGLAGLHVRGGDDDGPLDFGMGLRRVAGGACQAEGYWTRTPP